MMVQKVCGHDDVDDLIFGEEFSGYREKSQPCSER